MGLIFQLYSDLIHRNKNKINTAAMHKIIIPALFPAFLRSSYNSSFSAKTAFADGKKAKTINPSKPAAKNQINGLNPFFEAIKALIVPKIKRSTICIYVKIIIVPTLCRSFGCLRFFCMNANVRPLNAAKVEPLISTLKAGSVAI